MSEIGSCVLGGNGEAGNDGHASGTHRCSTKDGTTREAGRQCLRERDKTMIGHRVLHFGEEYDVVPASHSTAISPEVGRGCRGIPAGS